MPHFPAPQWPSNSISGSSSVIILTSSVPLDPRSLPRTKTAHLIALPIPISTAALDPRAQDLLATLASLEEFSELFLAFLERLGRGCVRHVEHWAPQVEVVGDVAGGAEQDDEDEE